MREMESKDITLREMVKTQKKGAREMKRGRER